MPHDAFDALVTLATRHHDALGGLAALLAATVEGFAPDERDSRPGALLRGLAALLDQQRNEAAAIAERIEDAADAFDATPSLQAGAGSTIATSTD